METESLALPLAGAARRQWTGDGGEPRFPPRPGRARPAWPDPAVLRKRTALPAAPALEEFAACLTCAGTGTEGPGRSPRGSSWLAILYFYVNLETEQTASRLCGGSAALGCCGTAGRPPTLRARQSRGGPLGRCRKSPRALGRYAERRAFPAALTQDPQLVWENTTTGDVWAARETAGAGHLTHDMQGLFFTWLEKHVSRLLIQPPEPVTA